MHNQIQKGTLYYMYIEKFKQYYLVNNYYAFCIQSQVTNEHNIVCGLIHLNTA